MTRKVGFNDSKSPDNAPTNTAWEGILDAGERILWQGRPDASIVIKPATIFIIFFGCIFAGFALFWMATSLQAGGFFWLFGLPHFGIGIFIIFTAIYGGSYMRKRTWYTLTDKRALIATDLPIKGRGMKSYPITAETQLDFQDNDPATIYFFKRIRRNKNGTHTVNVGFERIPDGRKVYGLMRRIQGGNA